MMMMETIVVVRASGRSMSMVVLGGVRGGRVPVVLVALTILGGDGAEADGRIPALLIIIPSGLGILATSIDVIRVLFRRLSGKAEAWLRLTVRVSREAVR